MAWWGKGGANSLRTQEKSGSLQGQGLVPGTIPLGILGTPWVAKVPQRNSLWGQTLAL